MWISLIGFNAAGKTTLAREFARISGWRAVDLDRVVERTAGRSLPAIFAADGPPGYRALEAQVLADLPADGSLVVATGAGTLEREGAAALLAARGLVVWLDAPWLVLRNRLAPSPGTAPTPIWTHLGEAGLAALYVRRRPLYAAVARLRLDGARSETPRLARRLLGRVLQLQALAGAAA